MLEICNEVSISICFLTLALYTINYLQKRKQEQNGRLSELVAEKFRENFIIEECRYIAVDEINIEIKRVKTEQEKLDIWNF